MKKTIAVLLAVVFILSGCVVIKDDNIAQNDPSVMKVTEKITVTVLGFEGEELLNKEFDIKGEATALTALQSAAPGEVKMSSTAMPYVTEILGLGEKDHGAMSGWTYEVNGKAPTVGADKYILKSGDRVEWIYFAQ